MSKQFHNAISNIVSMGYFKNEAHSSKGASFGHEDAVAVRLSNAGFKEVSKEDYPKATKGLLKKWANTNDDTMLRKATEKMPNGSFMIQPAGPQGFPDILVKDFCGRYIAVECKSSKSGSCPMWNDNVPRPNAIYIFSAGGKINQTTVFMGRDVISDKMYKLFARQEAAMEAIAKQFKLEGQALDKFNRGWLQKARKQHFQAGGADKTNYFKHADRESCETNVLMYAND